MSPTVTATSHTPFLTGCRPLAFVFPGQGAQSVGMGGWLSNFSAATKQVFHTLEQISGEPILDLCLNGPEATLKQTRYTQPAILGVSLAAWIAFNESIAPQLDIPLNTLLPDIAFAAGHSLGEFAGLFAAGVLDLETVCHVVNERAQLMGNAPAGAMSVVLGLPAAAVQSALRTLDLMPGETVCVANDNTPDQVVIAGSPDAVSVAAPALKAAGAKRVLPLPVGGAFHSPLMKPAAEAFTLLLKDIPFGHASFPIITNVDAALTTQADDFRDKSGRQLASGVRWTESMDRLFAEQGVTTVIEFGPGTVLTGMVRKGYPTVQTFNVFDEESLNATIEGVLPLFQSFNLKVLSTTPV